MTKLSAKITDAAKLADALRAEAEQRIAPDLLDFGRRHGLETWVKEVFFGAFLEGVKYANSGRGWCTFAEALPEEGQAVVALYPDGIGGTTFRVREGWLTTIDFDEYGRPFVHLRCPLMEAYLDYPLWAPLPDGFKLWGEE